MSLDGLKGRLEALLFASGQPLAAGKLAAILNIDIAQVGGVIAQLKHAMTAADRGLTIVEVAGGYQLCTKPHLSTLVEQLADVQEVRLSSAAMETLAIIAFRQPVTKVEIENIRGVKADRVLTTLLERGLICEVGRKDVLGRPILYGTTDDFLTCFGLNSVEDLPTM